MIDFFSRLSTNFDLTEDYINDMYLTERFGSVHDDYIGEDLCMSIENMFYYPYKALADTFSDMNGCKPIQVWVSPSYEDVSSIVLTYDLETMLYLDFVKAWTFTFESKEEFNRFFSSIYDEIKKRYYSIFEVKIFLRYAVEKESIRESILEQIGYKTEYFLEDYEKFKEVVRVGE